MRRMEPEEERPVLINQQALERSVPEELLEEIRSTYRRRGISLVTDLAGENQQDLGASLQVGALTGAENLEERQKAVREKEEKEAESLIKRVKRADPNSEDFWEGRIALFFGRDLEEQRLPERGHVEVHAGKESPGKEEHSRKEEGKTNFWSEHP
jgi:hypothetical protein